eukprot:8329099-Heterocapsa_arctica.AAC.1
MCVLDWLTSEVYYLYQSSPAQSGSSYENLDSLPHKIVTCIRSVGSGAVIGMRAPGRGARERGEWGALFWMTLTLVSGGACRPR